MQHAAADNEKMPDRVHIGKFFVQHVEDHTQSVGQTTCYQKPHTCRRHRCDKRFDGENDTPAHDKIQHER